MSRPTRADFIRTTSVEMLRELSRSPVRPDCTPEGRAPDASDMAWMAVKLAGKLADFLPADSFRDAAHDEREACAALCDAYADTQPARVEAGPRGTRTETARAFAARELAEAIRARGGAQPPTP